MPFFKDDKEAANHMTNLVKQFTDGKKTEELGFHSEFKSVEEIGENSRESLEGLAETVQNQVAGRLEISGVEHSISEASQHVEILDSVIAAKAKSRSQEA